jgi:hypothetical protein
MFIWHPMGVHARNHSPCGIRYALVCSTARTYFLRLRFFVFHGCYRQSSFVSARTRFTRFARARVRCARRASRVLAEFGNAAANGEVHRALLVATRLDGVALR